MARFNVLALLVDQFRFLVRLDSNKPAWATRLMVVALPIAVAVCSWQLGWRLSRVDPLLATLGLLAAVFVAAYALVFTVRLALNDRPQGVVTRKVEQSVDESAITLLAASLCSGLDALWLVAVAVTTPDGKAAANWQTNVAVLLGTLVVIYFLLSIRRLHEMYTTAFPPFWRRGASLPPRSRDDEGDRRLLVAAPLRKTA